MGRTSSTRVFRDALHNLALGVSETAGFEVVTISVAFDDVMETLTVIGDAETRERLVGRTLSIEDVEKELANADDWGDLRFIPYHRLSPATDELGSTSDDAESDEPDAWHPFDLLMAPIHDDASRLRAILSVDRPRNGRRPDPEALAHLQTFVAQTRRTVLYAMERVQLDEQIRMADAVRRVVREASSELAVDRILDYCQSALTETFDASGLWLQTFDEGRDTQGTIYATSGADIQLKEELRQVARPAARLLWDAQTVVEIAETIPRSEALTIEQEQQVFDFMRTIEVSSLLFIPLGAGRECLGNLVLTRTPAHPKHWTDLEKRTALDIGHDLGRALLNARSFERERHLVEELRELDSYKSRLIATLAHELKNPLTAILGHVEMLESVPELPRPALSSVGAVERGAARMQRLVEDLLALGKAGDPQVPFEPAPFDLMGGVEDVLDLVRVTVERKDLRVDVVTPDEPVVALGEARGLEQVLANLVSNAAKYTPEGGSITITLTPEDDEVVLAVADTGMGISQKDRAQLFTEFFRSTNPAAVALPGTGLGLAIAQRIVERHSGELTCDSVLGEGTTFTVRLPRAR